MANPYRVLGVDESAPEESIRARYEELARRYPPERAPDAFQRVREAYERIADRRSRLAFRIFDLSQGETIEEWLEEIRAEVKNRRLNLDDLRSFFQKR